MVSSAPHDIGTQHSKFAVGERAADPFRDKPALTDAEISALVKISAAKVLLPHPAVVAQFAGPVWPVVRNLVKRYTTDEERTLVYDDNMLARWALLWSHGFTRTGFPKGWTLAHVWSDAKEVTSFTSLANLALMPEFLGSLSDKEGPLAAFLRWHSFETYGWKPKDMERRQFPVLEKPRSYKEIEWSYLPYQENAPDLVQAKLATSNSKAANALKSVQSKSAV